MLALGQSVAEIPFHAAYILFSLIAAFSALALARRFSPHPLLATLLFCATPTFVINGTSLEADLPFVALWLLSTALYVVAVDRNSISLLIASSAAMALTALTAYQSILLVPILFLYGRKWRHGADRGVHSHRRALGLEYFRAALHGRASGGGSRELHDHVRAPGIGSKDEKRRRAHRPFGVARLPCPLDSSRSTRSLSPSRWAAFYDLNPLFWGSIAVGVGILIWCARHWRDFLAQWVLIFFAGALVIFFAGSARYLLPIALPIAILATQRARRRLLEISLACGFALSLALAVVNYQHWDGYRQFARGLQNDARAKRLWINGEWGLRYYFESEGGLPLHQGQAIHPGEMVVSSELGYPIPFTSGGGVMAPVAERSITSSIPLRIVALQGRAAYSTTILGLRPFDISRAPIDRLSAELMIEHQPALTDLPMNAAEAEQQIVTGIYQLESGQWRWMSQTATILLKPPEQPTPVTMRFTIPAASPARQVTIALNDHVVASQTYSAPGMYSLSSPPMKPEGDTAKLTIAVDKSFSVPGDNRQLGIILTGIGFK